MSRIEAQKVARRKRQIAQREIEKRKERIAKRLAESSAADRGAPMTQSDNIHYEVSSKVGGTGFGGMAAVHAFVKRIGSIPRSISGLRYLKSVAHTMNPIMY